MTAIVLNGRDLTPAALQAIGNGAAVDTDPRCRPAVEAARQLLQRAIDERRPVYGVTTGLGPQVSADIPDHAIDSFALSTLRGRAHALGAPLPRHWVRAALAVRLNTLLIGATGVRPALLDFLCQCLNRDLAPRVGESASIGAADLLWGATCGLALCGEGQMIGADGGLLEAGEALRAAGLTAWQPAPREGLALASHSGFSAAIAALGLHQAEQLLARASAAMALSIEGFEANLSPLHPSVLRLRPQPGQSRAAQMLSEQLAGSRLFDSANARRLQDPLSIRNAVQVLGACCAALDFAVDANHGELNGVTDNPAVLIDEQQILSHGGYLAPLLGLSLNALCQALAGLAAQQVARLSKLLNHRFSDLPTGLKPGGADSAGLAPLMKVAEALMMEINQLAQSPSIAPSPSADSLEDTHSSAPLMARTLHALNDKLRYLIAIEMLVATHAIRLRAAPAAAPALPPALLSLYQSIADASAPMLRDRSLTAELERLAQRLA